jgi:hypothetical protein
VKEDRGKEGYMGKGRLLEGSRTVWGKELKHELDLLIMVKYALALLERCCSTLEL